MSTLYIRLPSKAVADSMDAGAPLYCHFAQASASGAVEREGVAALSELSEAAGRAQRVVVLLAASDVTLLRIKMPPLSGARLKAALPNLIEDHLMSDPADCVMVAGPSVDGLRTVAVVQRSWLEIVAKTLTGLGARRMSAVPAQLCLPYEAGAASAAITEHGADIDVAVRLSEQDGIGLPITADQPELAPVEVIQSVCAVVPHSPIVLYVPQARVNDYQETVGAVPALDGRIALHADNWPRWIAGANKNPLDLMTGFGMSSGPAFNWRPWRWPLILAAAVLMINAIALNIDWLRAKREADALRMTMVQIYKSAYPKETVIVDPMAQMRQKYAAAQRESGQIAPDDFVALAAAFGEAWGSAGQQPQSIAGLEYRERSLSVKLKPGTNVSLEQMQPALAAQNLSVSQPNSDVLQVRSGK